MAESALTESEFPKALDTLEGWLTKWAEYGLKIARLVGRMSAVQLREVKRRFRMLRADHWERLALLGRGLIGEHLALPEAGVPATDLKRASEKARADLADPSREVEVYHGSGRVLRKPLKDMTAMEMRQVWDRTKGLLTPLQQRRKLQAAFARPRGVPLMDAEDLTFESAQTTDDGAVVWWRYESDPPGTQRFRGLLPGMKVLK